ncbi:hypothetical protein CLE01_25110 [Cryobacterium levicorallinum]|nr:hypothetical protein CLE01_25110 [Cryobacterium levicorallinum]
MELTKISINEKGLRPVRVMTTGAFVADDPNGRAIVDCGSVAVAESTTGTLMPIPLSSFAAWAPDIPVLEPKKTRRARTPTSRILGDRRWLDTVTSLPPSLASRLGLGVFDPGGGTLRAPEASEPH